MSVAIMIFTILVLGIWVLTLFHAEKFGDYLIKLFKRIVFGKDTSKENNEKVNGGNENV